jgi:hypothetical protein
MKTALLNILCLITCCSFTFTQSIENRNSAIARAGDIFISEHEFQERYELLPGQYRNSSSNLEESKLVFVYSLIAEKLLAQAALSKHLDQDSVYISAVTEIKKMLARDQLYRGEISDKIEISRPEVNRAIIDAKRLLKITYLFCEEKNDADFLRRQLKNCSQFNKFQVDTASGIIRDTVSLAWGEAEAAIELAAFKLKRGECSPVVSASAGFYIIHLDSESTNSLYTTQQSDVLYERIETKLRLRKEYARLDEYTQKILKTKTGYSLPKPFKMLAHSIDEILDTHSHESDVMVTDSLLQILKNRCQPILRDSMIVISDSFWKVEDVLNKLRGKIFRPTPGRATGIAAQLNSHLRIFVQQELLAEEALSKGLDEHWSVKNELDIWRQQLLAKMEEMNIQQSIRVTDIDAIRYLSETNPNLQFPHVQLRELHTKDIKSMDNAMQELHAGESFENVINKRSAEDNSNLKIGITEEFPINKRLPVGLIAWNMKISERHGPIRLNGEYIYFELLKKMVPAGLDDSSFTSLVQKSVSEVRKLKQKQLNDLSIAKAAQQRGYDIYEDRLKQLKVSNVPMMTYRILGFGGKMFAAPFVTRNIDWVGIENPESIPLP